MAGIGEVLGELDPDERLEFGKAARELSLRTGWLRWVRGGPDLVGFDAIE